MTLRLKKQEEQDLQCIRELLRLPENKRCFDCFTKSPFFVDMTIQTFVCARCSGLVREVGHRVKSISTSKFSGPETISLEMGGNAMAKRIWLHNYGGSGDMEWIESDYDVRLFMRQKYYELRWFDRALWNEHGDKVKQLIVEQFTEDGLRRNSNVSSRRLSVKTSSPTSTNFILPPPPTSPNTIKHHTSPTTIRYPTTTTTSLANEDDDCPLGLTAAANTFIPMQPQQNHQQPLFSDDDLWMNSPITPATLTSMATPISPTSTTTNVPRPSFMDDFGDKPLETTTSSPIQPLAPPPSSTSSFRKLSFPTTTTSSHNKTHPSSPHFLPRGHQSPTSSSPPQPIDPFAALRGLSF